MMKLGLRPARRDPRTLKLASYLPAVLPEVPDAIDESREVDPWPLFQNDRIGNCAIVAALHMEMHWHSEAGREFVPTDQDAIDAYEAVGGYVAGHPETDEGCTALDTLRYWKRNGIARKQIAAYVALDAVNERHVRTSVYLFSGVYVGLQLPRSAMRQDLWDAADGPSGRVGSWGGHAVHVLGYSPAELLCVTWGKVKRMTWDFWNRYAGEAYAVLSENDLCSTGLTEEGFDLEQLRANLEALKA